MARLARDREATARAGAWLRGSYRESQVKCIPWKRYVGVRDPQGLRVALLGDRSLKEGLSENDSPGVALTHPDCVLLGHRHTRRTTVRGHREVAAVHTPGSGAQEDAARPAASSHGASISCCTSGLQTRDTMNVGCLYAR